MVNRFPLCALLSLPLIVPVLCAAQRYVPPPPPLTVDPCAAKANPKIPAAVDAKAKTPMCPPPAAPVAQPPSGAAPAAAEQFPFPGNTPARTEGKPAPSTAEQFPYPGSAAPQSGAGAAAPAAKTSVPAGGAGGQFPYPGETSTSPDAVPEGNIPRYVPDSPAPGEKGAPAGGAASPAGSSPSGSSSSGSSSSGSSSSGSGDESSSSSSSSSGDAGVTPGDAAAPGEKAPAAGASGDPHAAGGRRHLPKVSAQSADERVAEDLNVAEFYSERGNYQAAYLRGKDATTIMPNDAESHFTLAEAARRLQKKDEAAAEYALYLKLDPGGDKIAAAEKALSQLR